MVGIERKSLTGRLVKGKKMAELPALIENHKVNGPAISEQ
jgi:hypothetical protein